MKAEDCLLHCFSLCLIIGRCKHLYTQPFTYEYYQQQRKMTDRQTTDRQQTDNRQTETVAETNKGVVEVLAVRLRTNIYDIEALLVSSVPQKIFD